MRNGRIYVLLCASLFWLSATAAGHGGNAPPPPPEPPPPIEPEPQPPPPPKPPPPPPLPPQPPQTPIPPRTPPPTSGGDEGGDQPPGPDRGGEGSGDEEAPPEDVPPKGDEPEAEAPTTPSGPGEKPDEEPPHPDDPSRPGGEGPTTPGEGERPDPGKRGNGRRGRVPRRATPSTEDRSWRVWWEFNREHLLGLRGLVRDSAVTTGQRIAGPRDGLGAYRVHALVALRRLARSERNPDLRATALVALGRLGDSRDVQLLLRLLEQPRKLSKPVEEAALLALGILPTLKDPEATAAVRRYLTYALKHPQSLRRRASGFAILAAGMRAREERGLVPALIGRASSGGRHTEDAALILLAAGLCRDPRVVPNLMVATRKRKLGDVRLSDVAMGHGAAALAHCGEPFAVEALTSMLKSRRTGVQAKRAAALALGRLLRETTPNEERRSAAVQVLQRTVERGRDLLLRGFATIALGTARPPAQLKLLRRAATGDKEAALRPFACLSLGFAARTLIRTNPEEAKEIQELLASLLERARGFELKAALCVAVGLAGDRTQWKPLLDLLAAETKPHALRGAAAQALGLLRVRAPEVDAALVRAVRDAGPLMEDAALALGLLGRRGASKNLVEMLPKASSLQAQGRLILALARLQHAETVPTLLKILENPLERIPVREFAAVALGLMGDRRTADPLFEIDAYFNYYATVAATHELIAIY